MLEEVIKEQTAAIKEQTAVLQKLVTAIAVNVAGKPQLAVTGSVETVIATQAERAEAHMEAVTAYIGADSVAPKTAAVEKPKTKAKPAPKSEELQMMEEVIEAEEGFKLPDGERNDTYYVKHVQPVCLELVAKNKPALVKIVTEHFGAKSAKLIPADKWDELVVMVKAEL